MALSQKSAILIKRKMIFPNFTQTLSLSDRKMGGGRDERCFVNQTVYLKVMENMLKECTLSTELSAYI